MKQFFSKTVFIVPQGVDIIIGRFNINAIAEDTGRSLLKLGVELPPFSDNGLFFTGYMK